MSAAAKPAPKAPAQKSTRELLERRALSLADLQAELDLLRALAIWVPPESGEPSLLQPPGGHLPAEQRAAVEQALLASRSAMVRLAARFTACDRSLWAAVDGEKKGGGR